MMDDNEIKNRWKKKKISEIIKKPDKPVNKLFSDKEVHLSDEWNIASFF